MPAECASPAPSSPHLEKRFACSEPGCPRAFVHAEHLSRHRLNHRPRKVFACPQCPKKFVRPDLYQRHKARHDRGMWYRNVGGVVDAEAQEIQTRTPEPSSLDDTVGSESCQLQNDTPRDRVSYDIRTNRDEFEHHSEVPVPVEASDHVSVNSNTYDENVVTGGPGFNYRSPPDGPDTLFFDGSANIYDLPEGLDWFFEVPQPDALTNMDIVTTDPIPSHHTLIPSPLSIDQQSASGLLPSLSDNTWPTVQARLIESLYSLPPDILQSCFFYPSNLTTCYELYFEKYHHHFPFLHRATLSVTEAEPLLIASIITLGSTMISDKAIYGIGHRIHDSLRWIIFQTGKFEPPSPLWCLQALLLVQAQAKMFSTRKHHEMAHIFHGSILTMMKRGRAYSPMPEESNDCTTLEYSWRQWAEQESSRRTAFFAFIMDAQHASVFGHTPVLSVSDVRLPLPCIEPLWECTSSSQWQHLSQRAPESPQFLPTLKAVLAKTLVPTVCSDYSRFIILHGLLGLITHLRARETQTLGIETGKIGHATRCTCKDGTPTPGPVSQVEDWIEVISRAIGTWSFSLLSLEPSLCLEAARPLHRMAFITLHTNITDFHILAKDPTLLENALSRREASEAEARIRSWSRKEEAKRAVTHSLMLVKETVFAGYLYRAREDNIAARPWCLYHAILVLWAYGVMTEGPEEETGVLVRAEEYAARMLSALQNGLPGKPVIGANRTKGFLCAMVAAFERCTWALLEEAYQTLRRLVNGPA